jgi:hypothetical protein
MLLLTHSKTITENKNKEVMNLDLQLIVNVVVPFVIFAVGLLYKRIGKIEERQYDMKGQLVTKDELQKTEDRITHNLDERVHALSTKLDVLINQQNMLILERDRK